MPHMKPPHFGGVTYNGLLVTEENLPDVLAVDVEALQLAGWVLAGSKPKSVKPDETKKTKKAAKTNKAADKDDQQ